MKKKLPDNKIVFYKSQDGNIHVEVRYAEENIWLNQKAIAELFGTDISTINEHIKNIYKRGELEEDSTFGKFPIVQKEGKRMKNRYVVKEKVYNCYGVL